MTNGDSAQAADGQANDASTVDASPEASKDAVAKPQTNGIHADKLAEAKATAPTPASFAAKAGAKVPAAPVRSWAQIAK